MGQPDVHPEIDLDRVPRHVAIIMDGNGRWAVERGLERNAGHREGSPDPAGPEPDGTEPGPIHDLFVYLANEETQHKSELEKLYYETVHSGGV